LAVKFKYNTQSLPIKINGKDIMLKVRNLYKLYNGAKYASVSNISFDLAKGEICGFLGMNGAGKSTTIKCITGIIPYTFGKVEICGYDIKENLYDAKMSFGFVPDNHAVYGKLTGNEYVKYAADLYKVPLADRKRTLDKFVEIFNLGPAMNRQIFSYSHGMKQKICIIAALIHNPKLWILDEPMVGLDPQSMFEVKQYMREHVKAGNTVFFSSHSLDTVEKLCDRALIVHGGKLLDVADLNQYRKENISLEDRFLKLTEAADVKLKKDIRILDNVEAALAQKYGKRKANELIINRVLEKLKKQFNNGAENN